jgi:serine/threonine protein kinase
MSRFRIISKLGAGGFGEAFRAWDREHGVPVVLKRPLAKHLQRPDVLERFDREITRLLELKHPSIVPIVDHGHDAAGLPYLAMRFLPAGSLADRKKPHPFSFLHRWLPSVAAALDHVHARGVVHRDVKPANIFFDTDSRAYLGDFGIAKVIDDELAEQVEHSLTSTGGEIGTYPYMAPEFFRKPRVLTGAYDQYSLAISVYEMICGRRPFSGDSGQLIVAHVTQSPPDIRRFSGDAPSSLCAAVARALAKHPADRFRTCVEFADATLQDVGLASRDESVRRFLCPSCHTLVKVPAEFSGRSCRCPDCIALLRVSEKLDALWLKQEDPSSVDAHVPPRDVVKAADASAALANEGELDAADRRHQEVLPPPRTQITQAHTGETRVAIKGASSSALSLMRSRWGTLSPIAKVLAVLCAFIFSYALIVRLSLSHNSPHPVAATTNATKAHGTAPSETPGGLSAAVALNLIGTHEGVLVLDNETQLQDEAAAVLATYRGDLHLPNVTAITLRATKALASHDGWLGLNGIGGLTADQLRVLATHDGPVSLLGLSSLPPEAAEAVASADNLLIPLHLQPASTESSVPMIGEPPGQ